MKKFCLMVVTSVASLLPGLALAQNSATCVFDPSDPSCVCVNGETDADCIGGVHRGLWQDGGHRSVSIDMQDNAVSFVLARR